MTTLPHLNRPQPAVMRMNNGRIVPAQMDIGHRKPEGQKFLIVLQYYDGDVAEMEEVANIIADMERVRNHEADIMLFGRFDAKPFPAHIKSKLESKFDKVHTVTCRSRDGKSYPFASNCMFYDLVTLLGQYEQWNRPYFAFINLESDCVPVHPGWIRQLIAEFRQAQGRGKHAIGHIHNGKEAPVHMNGVAVYAIDIYDKVPGGKLRGGMPNVAYDLYQAPNILPLAESTPYIHMEYRRPTITSDDLFSPDGGKIEPALYHGVKDSSAREAVRARHITFSEKKDLSRVTVFAYQDSIRDIGHGESDEVAELWKQGWKSRGWNPVVLRLMDASRNPRFQEIEKAIAILPYAGSKKQQRSEFLRILALDTVGGGFMVEIDQQPNSMTPAKMKNELIVTRKQMKEFFDRVTEYVIDEEKDVLSGLPHVSAEGIGEFKANSMEIISVADVGGTGYKSADIVDFSERALNDSRFRGVRKSEVIREYLRGAI